MFLVNDSLIFNLFVSLSTFFVVIYVYFQWVYQTWDRKKVPYFKPTFPLGNRKAVRQPVSIGEDIFMLTKAAKANGTYNRIENELEMELFYKCLIEYFKKLLRPHKN